ncbi:hypothetical protein LX16_0489 [Stackebrandtia albiflava]|uniref:Cold shock CspA family protein n=1 Tax=Stackebrandtia albiflava TaxID=406432 RepID=A0A562VAC2_9ACTN|nr:cold-shock protein [Stackebrandtia albiflava]TWJ14798.1 hypothetical protein LX16_0489 [Stackebrandtia albiflava]
MQGTVATFDPQERSGSVFLDNGTEVRFGSDAFDASGLRLLRLGQRLNLSVDDTGTVSSINIPTMRRADSIPSTIANPGGQRLP